MTDKQINQQIAEVCGWTEIQNTINGCYGLKSPTRGYIRIPNYSHDLNAMHEAEKILAPMDLGAMAYWLKNIMPMHAETFHSTARQRAEAFLRTLGKWEEVQK